MKKKTLIKLFLTSSIFLLLAGCNKEVKPVTSEVISESIEVVSEDTSIEDTSIEETVSEEIESDVTSEVESVNTSEKVIEAVPENVTTNTEATEVITVDKKVKYISGMPTADAEKYNKYIASIEQPTTSETGDPTVTPKQNGQKTGTKKQVVKEEVKPTIVDVTNPSAEATLTNLSQEMANLLNAKRGELGFPQTVEVIPESDVAVHNFAKQSTINLYTIGFNHESSVGIAEGLNFRGSVIGRAGYNDAAGMFNCWMNSPGHYATIIPNGESSLRPEEVMQIVCYSYGPCEDGFYYYSLDYRVKPKYDMNQIEDWQKPYIDEEDTNPEVHADNDTGVVDNLANESILDALIGTDYFWEYFNSCPPELQEHYRQKHPELFN